MMISSQDLYSLLITEKINGKVIHRELAFFIRHSHENILVLDNNCQTPTDTTTVTYKRKGLAAQPLEYRPGTQMFET